MSNTSNGTPQPNQQPQQQQPQQQQNAAQVAASQQLISALATAFKSQTGENLQQDRIAALLLQNMSQISDLAKQGKLNQTQIMQLKEFANANKVLAAPNAQSNGAGPSKLTQPTQPQQNTAAAPSALNTSTAAAFKSASPALTLSSTTGNGYPISQTLNVANPGPQHYPMATGRPTLSGGFASGRVSGTPSQIARSEDTNALGVTDNSNRRKNTPNDQSMRRSIQDLVFSIDPNVKIEPEVEDLLLDVADEFIDSVTNFGCRLAKHRGGDTLEVRDLQLHLERNHNIRIPGFASDETRISISQSAITPAPGAAGSSSNKKNAQNANVTLRSQRLAQVAQAKKDAKLM